jgi:hypothetical protein
MKPQAADAGPRVVAVGPAFKRQSALICSSGVDVRSGARVARGGAAIAVTRRQPARGTTVKMA